MDKVVELPTITAQVIADAPGDLAIAEEAVDALTKARGEPEWNPFREQGSGVELEENSHD